MTALLREAVHSEWAQQLGWTLLHSLWQGAAVALVLALALLALRGSRPQARYLASCAAMALLALLPALTFLRSGVEPQGAVRAATATAAPATVTPGGAAAPEAIPSPPEGVAPVSP